MDNGSGFDEIRKRVVGFDDEIETIKKIVDDSWVEAPDINISTNITDYADNLRAQDEERRAPAMKKFVGNLVGEELEAWHAKIRPLLDLRHEVDDVSQRLERQEKDIQSKINAQGDREITANEKITQLKRRHDKEKTKLDEIKSVSKYSTISVWALIIVVILIALATGYYYLAAQGQIQVAKAGGVEAYFADLDLANPRFTVWNFLRQSPINFLYGFGALIFIAIGKGAGVIYSKIGHPKWMMITSFILAAIVVFGTIFLVSEVQTQASKMEDLQVQLDKVNESISDYGIVNPALLCNGEDRDNAMCQEKNRLEEPLEIEKNATKALTFWMSISILFSEVLLGAFVWIYAADHFELNAPGRVQQQGKVDSAKNNIVDLEKDRNQLMSQTRVLEEARDRNANQQMELRTIQAKILGPDAIAKRKQAILSKQEAAAESELFKAITKWRNDAAKGA